MDRMIQGAIYGFVIGIVCGILLGVAVATADASEGLKFTIVNEAQKCADVEIKKHWTPGEKMNSVSLYEFKLQGRKHRDPKIAPDTRDVILVPRTKYIICVQFCKQKIKCETFEMPDKILYEMFDENGIKYRQYLRLENPEE